jgi:hypothetical protein
MTDAADAIVLIVILVVVVLILIGIIWVQQSEIDKLKAEQGYDEETIRFLKSDVSKFDHDGDGKPGGSKKRAF